MATGKAERRAARDLVATYHESSLTELVDRLATALDDYRAASIDVHHADEAIHHYHRAARELWKFCFGAGLDVEIVARLIDDQPHSIDWWARGPSATATDQQRTATRPAPTGRPYPRIALRLGQTWTRTHLQLRPQQWCLFKIK